MEEGCDVTWDASRDAEDDRMTVEIAERWEALRERRAAAFDAAFLERMADLEKQRTTGQAVASGHEALELFHSLSRRRRRRRTRQDHVPRLLAMGKGFHGLGHPALTAVCRFGSVRD